MHTIFIVHFETSLKCPNVFEAFKTILENGDKLVFYSNEFTPSVIGTTLGKNKVASEGAKNIEVSVRGEKEDELYAPPKILVLERSVYEKGYKGPIRIVWFAENDTDYKVIKDDIQKRTGADISLAFFVSSSDLNRVFFTKALEAYSNIFDTRKEFRFDLFCKWLTSVGLFLKSNSGDFKPQGAAPKPLSHTNRIVAMSGGGDGEVKSTAKGSSFLTKGLETLEFVARVMVGPVVPKQRPDAVISGEAAILELHRNLKLEPLKVPLLRGHAPYDTVGGNKGTYDPPKVSDVTTPQESKADRLPILKSGDEPKLNSHTSQLTTVSNSSTTSTQQQQPQQQQPPQEQKRASTSLRKN